MATPKKSSKSAKSTPQPTAKPDAAAAKKTTAAHAAAIDPSHAAQSVAAALAARVKHGGTVTGASSTPVAGTGDSASFKNLKAGLSKPQFSSSSPLAGGSHGAKFDTASKFAKPTGHGQAGGANVARTGVPRRTNGG